MAVNKIGWDQVGRVAEPGRYMFRFGWLTITAEDLAIWAQFPNAVFALVRTSTVADADDAEQFHLGAFDLRNDPSFREE